MTTFINHGKHIEQEIDGIRCRVVDKGASRKRVEFLKTLLEHNGYEVKWVEEEPPAPKPAGEGSAADTPAEPTYTIGVTDITFNPVVKVFGRMLRTPDGKIVTPAIWNQLPPDPEAEHDWYWRYHYA